MNANSPPLPQLEIHGLTQRFSATTALAGVNLVCQPGERLAVLGPTGSGKTSLLRAIAGLDPIADGDVRFAGRSLARIPPHERDVAVVFQESTVYSHLSVAENLRLAVASSQPGRSAKRPETLREISELLGLVPLLGRPSDGLSGGERQRLAIARALVRSPRIICFDEPFSNLDQVARAQLRHTLRELHDRFPATWILVSHDPRDAALLGQRVAVLDEGRLLQVGTVEQLQDDPQHRRVAELVDDPPMNIVPSPSDPSLLLGFRADAGRLREAVAQGEAASLHPATEFISLTIHILAAVRTHGTWRVDGLYQQTPVSVVLLHPPGSELGIGRRASLHVRLEHTIYFDADSGQRRARPRPDGPAGA